MARIFAHNLKLLTIAVFALTLTASAQTTRMMRVNIPFDFSFGDHTFSAGQYELFEPEQHLLMLRNSDGRVIAQLFTEEVLSQTLPESSKLRFVHSDGQYRLSEVWQAADASGERLFPTKRPVKMAKRRTVDTQMSSEGGQP